MLSKNWIDMELEKVNVCDICNTSLAVSTCGICKRDMCFDHTRTIHILNRYPTKFTISVSKPYIDKERKKGTYKLEPGLLCIECARKVFGSIRDIDDETLDKLSPHFVNALSQITAMKGL